MAARVKGGLSRVMPSQGRPICRVPYLLNRIVGSEQRVAGPSCIIAASNFFELTVAVAIMVYGFESGTALATVVCVLVEVPAMLVVVPVVNCTRGWYERRSA